MPTVEQSEQVDEFQLPENSNTRTKEQFEKLLKKNKELNQKLSEIESTNKIEKVNYNSIYESFKFDKQANDLTVDGDYITDEGEVDIQKLNADLKALKLSTLEARRLAEQAREDVEVREAHMRHPYLDPNNLEFDSQFFELVKDRIVRQKFHEGKDIPLVKIADQVLNFYKPSTMSKKEIEKAKQESKMAQQQIANTAPVSQGIGKRVEGTDVAELRNRSMRGDEQAIIERLKNIGIIKK